MNDKKLALLGILAVLIATAAILQLQFQRNVHTADFSSSALIEGLDIDSVAAIEASSEKGSQAVKLTRKNGQFVVSDKDNYPADISKINDLINQCLDIRTVEKITSDPQNHEDLKVTEETARYRVSFLDSDEKPIVTLLFSEPNPETNTAYARLLSDNDVYSIQRPVWFNTQPIGYIDTQLLSLQRDKISSVAVKSPEESYVLMSPADSDEIQLEKIPEGKQYKDTVYKTVFGVLSSLRFEDVMRSSNAPDDLDFDSTYICKLYDLTVYKLSIAKKDDKAYVKVAADYLDKSPVEKTMGQVESKEELKKKEAKLLAIDIVKDFNALHKEWIYQISSGQAENLTKPLSALLEDIPETEDAVPSDASNMELPEGAGMEG